MPDTKKSAVAFSAEERAAMKDHAKELKTTAARRGSKSAKADGEADVRAKIAEFDDFDRPLAERVHAVVMAAVPELTPKLWYGMPAYTKDGKMVCFFQPAAKFRSRYATFGFSDPANLDDGNMWPTYYAIAKLTDADEARLTGLVQQAVS